jgi:hypothetical protein
MSEAMLDCAVCSTRKWMSVEPAAAEELRGAGAARLYCDGCGRETYWLYAQSHSGAAPQRKTPEPLPLRAAEPANLVAEAPTAPREESLRSCQTERRIGADRRQRSRRGQRRVALQLPVRVRINSLGAQFEETARTLNVCRNGIYFQTERPYAKGISAYVTLNYSTRDTGPVAEQRGTVVRVDSIAGSPARAVAIQLH